MRGISVHRGNDYMVERKGKNRLMWGDDCRWMGCGTHGWFELVRMVGRV